MIQENAFMLENIENEAIITILIRIERKKHSLGDRTI